jgi:hypothetical protein
MTQSLRRYASQEHSHLLTEKCFSEAGAARPQALSSWDHAFLKSLYSTDSGNITQLGEIKLTMYQDLVP